MAEKKSGLLPHTRWKHTAMGHDTSLLRSIAKLVQPSKSASTRMLLFLGILHLLFAQVACQEGEKKYFSIEENLPFGRTVGFVDSNPGYTYELVIDTDYFTIDQTSGEISTKQIIDREGLSSSDIKFVVKQKSGNVNTLIEVIITIVDVNDNSPSFASTTINYTIAEHDVPLQPFTLTAIDPDAGINGSSALTYSILSGNDENYWRITTSSSSGPKVGLLALLQEVDREEIDFFKLVIEARDGGVPSNYGIATVNILVQDLNDNHPQFDLTLYSASVLENATMGTKILETRAHDPDSGINSALVFSMTPNSLFTIDRLTGEISLEADLLNAGYSQEPTLCQTSYCNTTLCLSVCVIEVQVFDQEGEGSSRLQDQSRVKITIEDVNDHAPVIAELKDATVSEDAIVNTYIFRLTISDADKGPNGEWDLTYVSGNELGHFQQPQCILSRFCLIRTNALIDKEKIPRYNLTFAATDRGSIPLRTTISVIVNVLDANDHSPQFPSSSYSAVVSELDPVNSFVAAVTATDADEDENGRVTYRISDGNSQLFFKIDEDSGLVTINRRVDSDGLVSPRMILNISASDHGSNVLRNETTLEIDIIDENDEVPQFSQPEYYVEVQENNAEDLPLLTIEANDRDKGANGSVKYRLSDETVLEYPGLFYIGAISGELVVAKSLDREMQEGYTIVVVAYDLGTVISLSAQVLVHVNVTDKNDNTPIFYPTDYYAVIPETAGNGYSIVDVTATDPDVADNGAVRYSLSAASSATGNFIIDPVLGTVSLARVLPLSHRSYTIEVEARDGPGKLDRAEVHLKISNPEERNPEFSQQTYMFTVDEDADGSSAAIGQVVGTVNATGSTVLTYYITAGDPDKVFTINQNTGTITSTKRLDRDTVPAYHLTVIAEGISKITSASVNITLGDMNDNSPLFDQRSYDVETPEDTPLNSVVFVAQAKDLDAGNNAKVTYTISASVADRLAIDRDTGAIRLTKMILLGETLTFTVTATDGGQDPRSDSAQVVITASDVNDHSPVFIQREYYVAVNESDLINSRFLQLSAVDEDLGINSELTYSLVSGVNKTKPEFGVFPDGSLYIAQRLDREVKDRYQLLVAAQDGGVPLQRTDTAIVHVKVLDDNDNAPEFSSSLYEFRVLEAKKSGTYIGSVSARDADIGRNSDLMYFFKSNQQNFDLDPFTGEIRSNRLFDREARASYRLTVKAIDNGITRRHTETSVAIIIEDVNDNSPTFSRTVYDFVISEAVEAGYLINPITATDPDLDINGEVEYSIVSGNEDGNFQIDETSGALSVKNSLDRDIQSDYDIRVKAADKGNPPLSSDVTVHIKLSDANNRSPRFDPSSYSVNIAEGAEIGAVVGTVAATDDDIGANAVILYSITGGNEDGTFAIVRETGQVKLMKALDYEYKQLYTLRIRASNREPTPLSHQTVFSVNVEDENDNRPRFTDDLISVFVSENSSISTLVARLIANDSDSGINGLVTYAIVSQPTPEKFLIDADGQIFTKALLDRENDNNYDVVDEYTLVVEATDQAMPVSKRLSVRKTLIVSIVDVNDNSPEFVSLPSGVVQENSEGGTEVMTVRARDKDTGPNGQIQYSLKSGNNQFHIDTATGLITTAKSVSTSPVVHSITVVAADSGQPQRSSEQRLKIILTSVASSGLSLTPSQSTISLLETVTPGNNVILLSSDARDPEYYVTSITSSGQVQPGLFRMSSDLGQMKTAMKLDRDGGFVKYMVEVYVRDKDSDVPNTTRTSVEVTLLDVNDSPPAFTSSIFTASCTEDAQLGYTLTTVAANDPDQSGTVTYSLSDSGGLFIINNQGEVQVAGLLDRETTPKHTLIVQATDGSYTSSAQLIITLLDVNDEAPVFDLPFYALFISENASPGDPVGHVRAVDSDLGVGGEVLYKFVTTWGSDLFSINGQSGLITLEGALDYETVEMYVLQVEAIDKDPSQPLSSNVTLYINVIDENDNEPVFSPSTYSPLISEDVSPGSVVVTVSAVDYDAGVNGKIHYSILNNNLPFVIDGSNGTIYTSRPLDRETDSVYNVIVQAEDLASSNPMSSTVRVTVTVEDINDNAPVFTQPLVIHVSEATAAGADVATIIAIDADIGANGAVTYSLLSNADVFSINPNTGTIKILRSLDREQKANYSLRVKAEDGGAQSSVVECTLVVDDSNDNSPMFSSDQTTTIEVTENQASGVVLLNLSATDADTGLASEIRYYIIAGDPNEDFHLDQFTGKLSVSRGLDYERVQIYNLTVQAEDLGAESRFSTINVLVTVLDWNDCPPIFYHSPYYVYLQEETTQLPVELVTVEAVDADSAQYNRSTYELSFGLDDESQVSRNIFSIDANSGVLSAIQSVDREQKSSFTLKVIARNVAAGSMELTGEATVHVLVKDINDHAPTFDLPIYSTSIVEGPETGRQILRVTASDLDIGSNAEVRYTLVNDSVADNFNIDSLTGWISNSAALDREMADKYELTVIAYDLGDVSQSSESTVKIYMQDINDNFPVFLQEQFNIQIRDPTDAGNFVTGATAIDPDQGSNGYVTYSLMGPNSALFSIDSGTGNILSAERLDGPDAISFTVRATDGGNKHSDAIVTISFLSFAASQMPLFQQSISNLVLSEGHPLNTQFTKVTAIPQSSGGSIVYSIAGGNIAGTFSIKPDGKLVLTKELNYVVASAYNLWIEAKDVSNSISSYKNITVTVNDINDHAPEFEKALYFTSVLEEQTIVGAKVLVTVVATDPDTGANGEISYSLLEGNIGNPFILDSGGTLKLTKKLDRESIPRYNLIVQATDGGGLNSTTIVIVNVEDLNDMFPRFESIYRWEVPEDIAVGSVVSEVHATDRDIGANANIVYSLHEESSHFDVTPTGNVTVKAKLNREENTVYEVVVSAKNTGSDVLSGTTTVQITIADVNDNAPKFFPSSQYTVTFAEKQPAGSLVTVVNTSDADSPGPNSLVRYQLVNPSSFFLIDTADGTIRSKDVLEYDVTGIHNVYTLYVEARDSGVPSHTSVAAINITVLDANDHAPLFEQQGYFTAVPDDIEVGKELLRVKAEDNLDYSVNAVVTYSVVGGNGSSLFDVSASNGSVYVKSTLTSHSGQSWSVVVRATDLGTPAMSNTVTVTMLITAENSNAPTWVTADPVTVDVSESEEAGYELTTVQATDADQGINAQIVYSITPSSDLFHINSSTGRVVLSQKLDYEKSQQHRVNIQAEDGAFIPRLIHTVLNVNVLDADDNPPVFSQQVYIAEVLENGPSDTLVITVNATDADQGLNSQVRFSIIGEDNSKNYFTIDTVSGRITTTSSFDYEIRSEYELIVKASNPSSSAHESTARVKVDIKGVNEFAPTFIANQYSFDVSESVDVGFEVGRLRADDQDGGVDGQLEFLLVGDSNERGFSLDKDTGKLLVAGSLDRESVESIHLMALVKNPGPVTGNDTDTVSIWINLGDANDSPKFSHEVYNTSVQENLGNADVITVSATDTDQQASNRQFSYALENDFNLFYINPNSGKLTTTGSLDRETKEVYGVVVQAIDRGSPPRTGQAIVYVRVTDVNDNSPYFVPSIPEGEVLEGSQANTPVLRLDAFTFDRDVAPNQGPFRYYLSHAQFYVNENTGAVYTKGTNIDYEQTKQYIMDVEVKDRGGMTSQLTAKVLVKDINDQPSSPRDLTIIVQSYGIVVNGVIGSVEPLDVDLVGNYTCSVSSQPKFSIQGSTCMLRAVNVTADTSMQVSGSDGIHEHVQSSVNVKVRTYTNNTLDHTIVTRVSGITSKQFVERSDAFLSSINQHVSAGESAKLLAVQQAGEYVDLYLVLQRADNSYSSLTSILSTNKPGIERDSSISIISVKRNVCSTQSCSGRGECSSRVVVDKLLDYTSTDSLTLSYHTPLLVPTCNCEPEYMGTDCSEEARACRSTPCMNGGDCIPVGEDGFNCECTPQWTGSQCQHDVNECSGDIEICLNGGSCVNEPGSYKCECTENFAGPRCEEPIRCDQRNPCQNGAQCIDIASGGYTCECAYGFYGNVCQLSSYGFEESSYMELSPMNAISNDIKMTLSTESMNALLLFQPGLGSEFLALEIINGSVVLTFYLATTGRHGIAVSKNVSSGSWYRIHATRTSSRATLEVMYCESPTVCISPCNQQADCYISINLSGLDSDRINTDGKRVSVGGVSVINLLIPYAEFITSGSFVGCIGDLQLEGSTVSIEQAVDSVDIKDTCPRLIAEEATNQCSSVCGEGNLCQSWFSVLCSCDGFYSHTSCSETLINKDVAIGADAALVYKYRESYRSRVLLSPTAGRRRREISADSNQLQLSIRTGRDAVLMETQPAEPLRTLRIVSGFVTYGDVKNGLKFVADGNWHSVSLTVTKTSTILSVDDQLVTVNSSAVNFRDLNVVSGLVVAENYEGCIRGVMVNGDKLPMSDALTDKFEVTVTGSKRVFAGCDGCLTGVDWCTTGSKCDASSGTTACIVANPEKEGMPPWLLAVIIVLAVVFTLSAIFTAVCIANYCRKRKNKEKCSSTLNGTVPIMTSRLSENGSTGGHDNLPDSDILYTEEPHVTRKYNNMSPAIPALQASRTVPSPYQPLEDSTVIIEGSVTGGLGSVQGGINSDKFNSNQFYDFDETASIAPSDVDIRKYYKGYRKGDNMEMQMVPKHMRQQPSRPVRSPVSQVLPRESPLPRQYTSSPVHRKSPLVMNGGYDHNRQETPISQLQHHRHNTPIDELNRRIAIEQHTEAARRDSESSLTDSSMARQPNWTHTKNGPLPNSRPSSRSASRQNSRPGSRQQHMPHITNHISAQRQQDLNKLSHRSGSSSIDDSDDDLARRQPMERNIYSEGGDSSSDESSNDSFTASEFEADEPKVRNDYQPSNMMFTKLQEVEDESDTGDPNAYRTTFSWDGLRNVDNSLQRFINNSDSNTDLDSVTKGKKPQPPFRWDHFLSWGPSFEKLVGVFADIAELPQDYSSEIDIPPSQHSGDYV